MTIRDKHMYTSRQRASVIPVGRVFSLGPLADDGNHPEREGCPLTGGGSVRRADAALWGGGGGRAVARSPQSSSTWGLHSPTAMKPRCWGVRQLQRAVPSASALMVPRAAGRNAPQNFNLHNTSDPHFPERQWCLRYFQTHSPSHR